MTRSKAVEAVVEVVSPYIGSTMARSATEAHCQKLGIAEGSVSPEQRESLLLKLGGGLNIFLGRDKSASVIAEVRRAFDALEGPR